MPYDDFTPPPFDAYAMPYFLLDAYAAYIIIDKI